MPDTPLRIVVADDSPHFRRSICNILQREANLSVVAEAEDGLAAVQAAEKHRPDLVLMDISMPVMDGFDATRIIKSKFPDARILVLTMHDVESISEAACKAGACCYLSKCCSKDELFKTFKDCLQVS